MVNDFAWGELILGVLQLSKCQTLHLRMTNLRSFTLGGLCCDEHSWMADNLVWACCLYFSGVRI